MVQPPKCRILSIRLTAIQAFSPTPFFDWAFPPPAFLRVTFLGAALLGAALLGAAVLGADFLEADFLEADDREPAAAEVSLCLRPPGAAARRAFVCGSGIGCKHSDEEGRNGKVLVWVILRRAGVTHGVIVARGQWSWPKVCSVFLVVLKGEPTAKLGGYSQLF